MIDVSEVSIGEQSVTLCEYHLNIRSTLRGSELITDEYLSTLLVEPDRCTAIDRYSKNRCPRVNTENSSYCTHHQMTSDDRLIDYRSRNCEFL